jgi:hypothetical protein
MVENASFVKEVAHALFGMIRWRGKGRKDVLHPWDGQGKIPVGSRVYKNSVEKENFSFECRGFRIVKEISPDCDLNALSAKLFLGVQKSKGSFLKGLSAE